MNPCLLLSCSQSELNCSRYRNFPFVRNEQFSIRIKIALIFSFTLSEQEMPFPLSFLALLDKESSQLSHLVTFKQSASQKSRFDFVVAQRVCINWASSLDPSGHEIVGPGTSGAQPLTKVLQQADSRRRRKGGRVFCEKVCIQPSLSQQNTALDIFEVKVSTICAEGLED